MYNSNIRSRAGLVALIFFLISLVLAVPVPSKFGISKFDTTLSERSLDGTLPIATRDLAGRGISTDMDDELVRRGIGAKIKKAFQKVGHAIKHAAQKVGSGIKHAAQKIGSGIKHAAQKVGSGIKHAAQKVGSGIKYAAKKVGHFVKTTGAKIAKFGLKVVQSVGEVVGHVASFIPGVGKGIQQAIHGVSKVAGVVSDHIHANLGKKLEKGMKVMNKANKVMDFIPREFSEEEAFQERDDDHIHVNLGGHLDKGMKIVNKPVKVTGYVPREFSEEEAFQERDISDEYLEERDDTALENREDSYFEAYERDIYEEGYDLD